MREPSLTKNQLLKENTKLKQRIRALGISEAKSKRAEEALRASELLYQTIFETTGTAMLIVEEDMTISLANDRFESMTGYTRKEVEGKKRWTEFVEKSDLEKMITQHQLRRRDPGLAKKSYEFRLIHKDGCHKNIILTVDIIPATKRSVASLIDITERKRAEEALRESEEKYRTIIDQLEDGYFELDLAGNFTFFNDAECRNLGYGRDQLMGMNYRQYSDKKTADKVEKLFKRLYKTGEPIKAFDIEHTKQDGTKGFNEFSVTLINDSEGKPIGFRGISHNISERKLAEAELSRARDFVENIDDACFEMDLSGKLTFCNEAFLKTTGYTYDEYMALSRWDRHPTREEAKRVFKIYDEVYRTGTPVKSVEHKGIRKNGATTILEASISLVRDKAGNAVGFRGVGREITERKQAEKEKANLQDQLLQSQKMESVGRLAGGVAHDFNNMRGVIIGHSDIAMDHVVAGQPLLAHLMEIRKAAERSAKLTRQLLAFARKQTVSPRVLDVNETVDGMLKMLQRIMGEDIRLAWLPGVNLWQIKMDPSQIDQILANLCVNARDAIVGVGKVTIETENITFDEAYCIDHMDSVPGEYALLTVSDDGCGMSKDILGKIFEPFFTTKEVGKGTGLGLATVYGIVKQNNGFINVYSKPDKGTTFKIYLPRHIGKAEQTDMEKRREPVIGGQETVLVVEDEPAILALCKLMLENHGYQVLTAGTPGEAIRMAQEHLGKIHLLMTDVVMPEMNGRDLAKKILSLYPDIKRLFMSGYTADVIAHHGVLDEGVYFIQKPFSAIDLVANARAALDQK